LVSRIIMQQNEKFKFSHLTCLF